MKKGTILGLMTLILLTAGCGTKDQSANTDTQAVSVRVNTVRQGRSLSLVSASGKIEAVNSADLSTRMMGYVEKIYVQIGDKVQKGQLLLRINNSDITAKLAQVNANITEAEAAFSNAEKDFTRYTNLFRENSASQKELDDVTAQYQMAKARLKASREMRNEVNAQLSYANIKAPFPGVVTNKFIKEGDMANPGRPLLEMEAPGHYQVWAMVPESEIQHIRNEAEVMVHIKSLDRSLKGKVTEISTSAKNTGGQYLVKVVLDNTEVPLLSGMFATVQFPTKDSGVSATVMIPKEALTTKGQLSGVYTVSQSNTALLRWLRLGKSLGDSVEVLSGLDSGEQYVISAQGKLYNGAKITMQ